MHEETISEKEQTPNRSRHCNDHNGDDDDGEYGDGDDYDCDYGDGNEIYLFSMSDKDMIYFLVDFASMRITEEGGVYVAPSANKVQGFCRILQKKESGR